MAEVRDDALEEGLRLPEVAAELDEHHWDEEEERPPCAFIEDSTPLF